MAFAARQEDGKWRLCLRKGRTITHAKFKDVTVDIAFRSQAAAKACADALNERYWKHFERCLRKGEMPPFANEMVDLIEEHMK